MIEFPRNLTDELFDRQVRSAAVFRWEYAPISGNKTKRKNCIIIGHIRREIEGENVQDFYFFYTTKETQKYKENSRFVGSGVFIPASTFDFFSVDTVIQCSDLNHALGNVLRIEFSKTNFKWQGNLPENIWSKVISTAYSTKLLTPQEKDIIRDCLIPK